MVNVTLFKDSQLLHERMLAEANTAQVSSELPLLSNLNMLENIALINQYHLNQSLKESEKAARQVLSRLGYESCAEKRMLQSSETEIFMVKLIRAYLSPFNKVIVIQPSLLISEFSSDKLKQVLNAIETLSHDKAFEIFDLQFNQANYEGMACHIKK